MPHPDTASISIAPALEDALVALRRLLAAHGPACVCADCWTLTDAEAELEGLTHLARCVRQHAPGNVYWWRLWQAYLDETS